MLWRFILESSCKEREQFSYPIPYSRGKRSLEINSRYPNRLSTSINERRNTNPHSHPHPITQTPPSQNLQLPRPHRHDLVFRSSQPFIPSPSLQRANASHRTQAYNPTMLYCYKSTILTTTAPQHHQQHHQQHQQHQHQHQTSTSTSTAPMPSKYYIRFTIVKYRETMIHSDFWGSSVLSPTPPPPSNKPHTRSSLHNHQAIKSQNPHPPSSIPNRPQSSTRPMR